MITRSYFIAYRHVKEGGLSTAVTVGSKMYTAKSFLPLSPEVVMDALVSKIKNDTGFDSIAITTFNRV